jgi:uncharacterized protein YndB with AHSA1/START domain
MSDAPYELSVTRLIDATPEHCWSVWTGRFTEWWCPKPWTTEIVEQDLRAGGRSAVTMRGPNGEEILGDGVFLEVIPARKVVFTDAFQAGWIPHEAFFVGIMAFEAEGSGTRYTVAARHWSAEAAKRHEEMGFHPGWDIVSDQFKALCEER